MRDTTSAWAVAGEAHHHSAVALVQAATSLPTFLLALPAGVLADHYDRRRLLILCQVALAAAGAALAALSYAHALSVGAISVLALFAVSAAALAFRAELHEGFVFVGRSAGFRRILLRGSALYLCASCYLALTPLIAHDLMGSRAGVYGLLLAATGCGSIAGGVVLSAAKRRGVGDDALLIPCSAVGAAALLVLSRSHGPASASFALAFAGGSTLIQLATLNAAAQLLLPEAIRGRGLALCMAATFGCMAVGSLLWGAVSDVFSIGGALALGGIGFAAAALAGRALSLAPGLGSAATGTTP